MNFTVMITFDEASSDETSSDESRSAAEEAAYRARIKLVSPGGPVFHALRTGVHLLSGKGGGVVELDALPSALEPTPTTESLERHTAFSLSGTCW